MRAESVDAPFPERQDIAEAVGWWGDVGALLGGIGAGFLGFFGLKRFKRPDEPDRVVAAIERLNETVRSEMKELRGSFHKRFDMQRDQIERNRAEIERVSREVGAVKGDTQSLVMSSMTWRCRSGGRERD